MKDWRSQAHVKWICKYHVVIVPKYRSRKVFGRFRKEIGGILGQLCRQKEVELLEGNAASDHIHMLLSVPPKYSIAMMIGYLKGKCADRVHRELLKTQGTLFGRSFWSRGYCVTTVGPSGDFVVALVTPPLQRRLRLARTPRIKAAILPDQFQRKFLLDILALGSAETGVPDELTGLPTNQL